MSTLAALEPLSPVVAPPAGTVTDVGRRVDVDDMVSADEITERIRVATDKDTLTLQVVHNWAARHQDFPPPVKAWGNKRIWLWSEVRPWLEANGKIPKTPAAKRGRSV